MGTSTDAILYLGFDISEEEHYELIEKYGEDFDFEDTYAEKKGIVDNSGFWAEDGGYAFKRGTEEFDDACKKKDYYNRLKHEVIGDCKIITDFHGYGQGDSVDRTPIIALKTLTAHRGYPEDVNLEDFKASPEQIQELKDYCELMGIEYQEPKLRLASYWW